MIYPQKLFLLCMTLDRYFLFLYDSSKINLWPLVANQNDSDIGDNNYVLESKSNMQN